MIAWLLLCVLSGVLLGSAIMKTVAAARGTLSWPSGPVLLGWRLPAALVICFEAGVAAVSALLPTAWSVGLLTAASYALLAGAAATLRGRSCSCFGPSSGPVRLRHIVANMLAAVGGLIAAAATVTPPPPVFIRAAVIALVAVGIAATAMLSARHRRRRLAEQQSVCLADAHSVLVLTIEGCPACDALKILLGGSTGPAVRWHQITDRDDPHAALADGQFPCALAVDTADQLACPPRWGLEDINRMVRAFLDLELDRLPR
jgi:hypothetical protein